MWSVHLEWNLIAEWFAIQYVCIKLRPSSVSLLQPMCSFIYFVKLLVGVLTYLFIHVLLDLGVVLESNSAHPTGT